MNGNCWPKTYNIDFEEIQVYLNKEIRKKATWAQRDRNSLCEASERKGGGVWRLQTFFPYAVFLYRGVSFCSSLTKLNCYWDCVVNRSYSAATHLHAQTNTHRLKSLDCTKMVCSKFTAKRKVQSAFILPPTSTRPMCLVCQETIAVMKISNLKRHYEMKQRNFEETFPQTSEVRTTKINALKSSY